MCVCVCLCVLCIAYVCRCCLRLYVVYLFSANRCIHRVKNHVIRTCQVNNYLSVFSYSVCLEDSEKSTNERLTNFKIISNFRFISKCFLKATLSANLKCDKNLRKQSRVTKYNGKSVQYICKRAFQL